MLQLAALAMQAAPGLSQILLIVPITQGHALQWFAWQNPAGLHVPKGCFSMQAHPGRLQKLLPVPTTLVRALQWLARQTPKGEMLLDFGACF